MMKEERVGVQNGDIRVRSYTMAAVCDMAPAHQRQHVIVELERCCFQLIFLRLEHLALGKKSLELSMEGVRGVVRQWRRGNKTPRRSKGDWWAVEENKPMRCNRRQDAGTREVNVCARVRSECERASRKNDLIAGKQPKRASRKIEY